MEIAVANYYATSLLPFVLLWRIIKGEFKAQGCLVFNLLSNAREK